MILPKPSELNKDQLAVVLSHLLHLSVVMAEESDRFDEYYVVKSMEAIQVYVTYRVINTPIHQQTLGTQTTRGVDALNLVIKNLERHLKKEANEYPDGDGLLMRFIADLEKMIELAKGIDGQ